jgi:hypothetical protein
MTKNIMRKLLLFPLLSLTTVSFGQITYSSDSLQNDFSLRLEKSKRLMDSAVHPIKYARTLQDFLLATFPVESSKDGRWVYYNKRANLQRIEKPQIAKVLPNYTFYSVNLTNYLGWHVNQGTCVVLFDSLNSKFAFAEPLWYGGVSESLVKMFIGYKFNSKDTLLSFLAELNELMQVGSSYKFRQTSYSDSLITYDIGYFKGDSYTTSGNGISSSVNYNQDGVWRKIKIKVDNLTIIRYIQ